MSGRSARTIRIFSLEVSPDLVSLNIRELDFHDYRHFLKVTSSQNTFQWAPNGGPKGLLPWDPLGSQGFPSHGGSGTPSHGIPWAHKGSLSHGSPPMGSLGLPRVPSHGIPPHLPLNFCPAGQNINYKRINQRLFSEVSYGCVSFVVVNP